MAKQYRIQLHDHVTRWIIETAGGVCMVCVAGSPDQVALQDSAGASASNPVSITNGLIEFWTATTVLTVDLYGMAPGGQFFVAKGIAAGGPNEIYIDTGQLMQVARIPFSHADSTAATEKDTGFDLPQNAAVLPDGIGVHVNTADATETIDVGLLASEAGGDANGFIATLSVGTAGFIPAEATVAAGSNEAYFSATLLGALLRDFTAGTDLATDVGTYNPKRHVGDGTAKSISYTLTAGTDTADGFLVIPYILPAI